MTLKYDKENRTYEINHGDFEELARFIEEAEEILYDPRTGVWEIDGVRFSDEWFSNQVVMMSHFINVVAHMHSRKGLLTSRNVMARRLMDIQEGNVPGVKND